MKITSYKGTILFAFCSMFITLVAGCPMLIAPPSMSAPTLTAGNKQITASWVDPATWNWGSNSNADNDITSYNLRYREVGSESWNGVNSGITGTNHTITELTNGDTYHVQVRAVNAGGTGGWSASSTATPIAPPTVPPVAPGTMAAPTFEVGNGLLIATWTAPTDNGGSPITGYELQYRADDTEPWTLTSSGITCARSEGQAEVCQFSFSFYPPSYRPHHYIGHIITTDGASYQLRVRAVNAQGNGEWSATATTTLPTVTAKLPEGMAARAILSAEVSTIIATNDLTVSLTTVESGTYAVDESGDITITPATAPDGVTPPTVDSSSGLITVTADTTAGTYLVYGSDTGSTDILFAEYFYVTRSPTTNAQLKTAVNAGISSWGNTANLNYIITAAVRNMSEVFSSLLTFNGDISLWDTGAVTNMSGMFNRATAFNGDISKWDTGAVTDMSQMFQVATVFNSDISKWNVRSVTDMSQMFYLATAFNSNISKWNVSSVMNMFFMFNTASAFNQNLEEWKEHWTLDANDKYTGNKGSMFMASGVTTTPTWY